MREEKVTRRVLEDHRGHRMAKIQPMELQAQNRDEVAIISYFFKKPQCTVKLASRVLGFLKRPL